MISYGPELGGTGLGVAVLVGLNVGQIRDRRLHLQLVRVAGGQLIEIVWGKCVGGVKVETYTAAGKILCE